MAGDHVETKEHRVALYEVRKFAPPAPFRARANLKPRDLDALYAKAANHYVGFWAGLAREEIVWETPSTRDLDDSDPPNFRWFTGGALNVSSNRLDVHLRSWREDRHRFRRRAGDMRHISYRDLHAQACRFANALKHRASPRGSRGHLHAVDSRGSDRHAGCARIGAVHSVVSAASGARIGRPHDDAGAELPVTADGGWRGGHSVDLKSAAHKALQAGSPSIEKAIEYRRTGRPCEMYPGRASVAA